mmetsp:Transcript_23041/g.64836  ORF Transcript_23041/g.64836 Transcript_23041/m.64836 type:complete len:271 (+) Transcript_23041:298-1110(+)
MRVRQDEEQPLCGDCRHLLDFSAEDLQALDALAPSRARGLLQQRIHRHASPSRPEGEQRSRSRRGTVSNNEHSHLGIPGPKQVAQVRAHGREAGETLRELLGIGEQPQLQHRRGARQLKELVRVAGEVRHVLLLQHPELFLVLLCRQALRHSFVHLPLLLVRVPGGLTGRQGPRGEARARHVPIEAWSDAIRSSPLLDAVQQMVRSVAHQDKVLLAGKPNEVRCVWRISWQSTYALDGNLHQCGSMDELTRRCQLKSGTSGPILGKGLQP